VNLPSSPSPFSQNGRRGARRGAVSSFSQNGRRGARRGAILVPLLPSLGEGVRG